MDARSKKNLYLLMDSRDTPLAQCLLESPRESQQWQIQVLDDKESEVMLHEMVRLIPMADNSPALLGKILRSRGDRIILEKQQSLDSDQRQNVRVPVSFQSFIYPMSGRWRGRREIESNDLSCGGIAFFCAGAMELGERFEVVIPVTEQPVILRAQILRLRPTDREGTTMYAAKFVDMCYDEEMLVRESVFSLQLSARYKPSAR